MEKRFNGLCYKFENQEYGELCLAATTEKHSNYDFTNYGIFNLREIGLFAYMMTQHFNQGALAYAKVSHEYATRLPHSWLFNIKVESTKHKKLGTQMIQGIANHMHSAYKHNKIEGFSHYEAVGFYKKLNAMTYGANGQNFILSTRSPELNTTKFELLKNETLELDEIINNKERIQNA